MYNSGLFQVVQFRPVKLALRTYPVPFFIPVKVIFIFLREFITVVLVILLILYI